MSSQRTARLSDLTIGAAVERSGIDPGMVEWWDSTDNRITIRVEHTIGHYAERYLYPHMTEDDVVEAVQSASRQIRSVHDGG